jgi:hypothetical protein
MPRLQLEEVDFSLNRNAGKRYANVQLNLGGREYIGNYEVSGDDLQAEMHSVAMATFTATNQALSYTVGLTLNITLRAVEEMRPVFMDQPMFVVVVDVAFGERLLKPAGAVIAEHEDCYYATAAASLDAINRLVDKLLSMHNF